MHNTYSLCTRMHVDAPGDNAMRGIEGGKRVCITWNRIARGEIGFAKRRRTEGKNPSEKDGIDVRPRGGKIDRLNQQPAASAGKIFARSFAYSNTARSSRIVICARFFFSSLFLYCAYWHEKYVTRVRYWPYAITASRENGTFRSFRRTIFR